MENANRICRSSRDIGDGVRILCLPDSQRFTNVEIIMTHHQKEQILKVVEYYMTPELRERIMREVPVAYNAWVGYPVVEVRVINDATKD